MPGVQSVTGPNRTNVVFAERFSLPQGLDYKERAAKNTAAAFTVRGTEVNFSQRFLGYSDRFYHSFELCWFQREGAIGAFQRSRQGEMFFDNACPQSYGCHGNSNVHGVIRQSHRNVKPSRQLRNGSQIHLARRSRVSAGALQQCELPGSGLASSLNGFFDLLNRGHDSREDQRLVGG